MESKLLCEEFANKGDKYLQSFCKSNNQVCDDEDEDLVEEICETQQLMNGKKKEAHIYDKAKAYLKCDKVDIFCDQCQSKITSFQA